MSTETPGLDKSIQIILTDTTMTTDERASTAVLMIEHQVRAEFGHDLPQRLPVPAEWAHKIPAKPVAHRTPGTALAVIPKEEKKRWWKR